MELLIQASTIMVVGMAVTFVFLGVVIAGVNLSAKIIHRIEGAPVEEGAEGAGSPSGQATDRQRLVAAIAVALRHHRAPHRTA